MKMDIEEVVNDILSDRPGTENVRVNIVDWSNAFTAVGAVGRTVDGTQSLQKMRYLLCIWVYTEQRIIKIPSLFAVNNNQHAYNM